MKLAYLNAGSYENGTYSCDEAARHIVDNKLPNNNEYFYFVSFNNGSNYKMIVQKYVNDKYAAYILFGYGLQKGISYHIKENGVWR